MALVSTNGVMSEILCFTGPALSLLMKQQHRYRLHQAIVNTIGLARSFSSLFSSSFWLFNNLHKLFEGNMREKQTVLCVFTCFNTSPNMADTRHIYSYTTDNHDIYMYTNYSIKIQVT